MEKTGKKPNIIMILADDQGPWAMHCAGTPELYTPNLDRIAEQGMRFDSFFCASPVCSPARASILTGKMPSAHGVQDWLRSGNLDGEKFAAQGKENPYFEGYKQERKPISYLEGQPTYTDILAQNGYHCALSGKWHLGNSIEPQQGFQEWYTIGMGGCCYYHPDMVDHGEITVHHGEYVTDLITDRALEYLKELGEGTPRSICLSTILHPILPGKRSTILQSGSITTMAARFPAFQTCRIIPICAPARYMEPVRGKKICGAILRRSVRWMNRSADCWMQ